MTTEQRVCLMAQGDPQHKPAIMPISYDPPGTPNALTPKIGWHDKRETIWSCTDCFHELSDYVRYDLEGRNIRCMTDDHD